MVLTSHLSNAYDVFSSYCVSSSLLLSLMKMSMMTSLMMKVLGPGSPPVRDFLHFLNYQLIVLVYCCLTCAYSNQILFSVFLIFESLVSVISVIGRIRIVAQIWV